MNLVTKEGAQSVNFVSGAVVDNLSVGTPFEAIGKATLANNDTYYMNENNFGKADETQTTPITVGIKTVYLTEAPKAKAAPTAPQTTETDNLPTPELQNSNPAAPTTPTMPEYNLPWQRSMKLFMNPVPYVVDPKDNTQSVIVEELTTVNDENPVTITLPKGMSVMVGAHSYLVVPNITAHSLVLRKAPGTVSLLRRLLSRTPLIRRSTPGMTSTSLVLRQSRRYPRPSRRLSNRRPPPTAFCQG